MIGLIVMSSFLFSAGIVAVLDPALPSFVPFILLILGAVFFIAALIVESTREDEIKQQKAEIEKLQAEVNGMRKEMSLHKEELDKLIV